MILKKIVINHPIDGHCVKCVSMMENKLKNYKMVTSSFYFPDIMIVNIYYQLLSDYGHVLSTLLNISPGYRLYLN